MYGYDIPAGSDFGVTSLAQSQRTPEVQAYIDALEAYAAQQKGAGYLVRPGSQGADYSSMMAAGVKPEDYYQTGYHFKTNAGKNAKTKANRTGQIFYDPNKTYVFENERKNNKGTDYRTFDVTDRAAFDRMYAEAQRLSQTQGKKADWRVFEVDPTTGKRTVVADDDPKGPLGKIADIVAPILGQILIPIPGVGAAVGSAASGVAQGKSFENILKGAAISGGLSFVGGQAFGGAGGGGSSLASSITNEAMRNVGNIAAGGLGSAAGGAAGAAVSGLANGVGEIVVNGVRGAGSAVGNFLSNAASGAVGGLGSIANTGGGGYDGTPPENVDPRTIEVEGARPPVDDWGPLLPVGGLAAGAAGAGSLGGGAAQTAANTGPNSLGGQLAEAAAAGKLTPDIVKYLRAAGLLTGLVGDLFGGGGGSSARGNWKPGQLNPLFSAQLPGPSGSLANRQPRTMPAQDWNQYAMRPEQSFWSDVPQRYSPPPPSGSGGSMGGSLPPPSQPVRLRMPGYAEGGRADNHLARVSEGEYIIDAETVALLGDGSNDAGARKLDELRVNLRKDKGRDLARGDFSVDAKMPMDYIGGRN